jgi:WD40 repeat protein
MSPQTSVAFSPNGQRIAAAGQDGMIHFWAAPQQAVATQ